MSQILIYKCVPVTALDAEGGKILVETRNQVDAQKAGIPFKTMEGMQAVFQLWVPQEEIVKVD